jgi:hypothetical protein
MLQYFKNITITKQENMMTPKNQSTLPAESGSDQAATA